MDIFEPKKEIVYKQLKERILSGELAEGCKLPKELDFSKELGVAKVTLRSALSRLQEDGLVARLPSKGTFILPRNGTSMRTLLVLSSDLDHKESPNLYILPEIKRSAYKQGVEIESLDVDYVEALTNEDISRVFKEKNILAVILLASNFTGKESIIEKLNAPCRPVIIPHANPNDTAHTGFASIVVPQQPAWKEAVEYLAQLEHKRIGTIASSGTTTPFRGYSTSEYLELLKKLGLDADETLIKSGAYDRQIIMRLTRELMEQSSPPTAILCFSDFLAIYVYEALKELGLRIPDDVSVMGFCGFPGGAFLQPPLTTIDLEYSKLAEMSVELATNAKEWFLHDGAPPILIKKHKLLIRESTAVMVATNKMEDLNYAYGAI